MLVLHFTHTKKLVIFKQGRVNKIYSLSNEDMHFSLLSFINLIPTREQPWHAFSTVNH